MRPIAAVLAALALSAPAAVHAQPVSTPAGAGPDTYLEVHLGAFLVEQKELDLDPGWDVGGTFGARFNPNVSIEGELSYVRASGTSSLPGARTEQQLSMVPFMASLRLRLPFKAGEVAALGGAGLYFTSLEETSTIVVPGEPTTTTSDDSTTFGYHVGAALALNLSPTMAVGAEVRRTFLNGTFEGADVALGGVRVALTLAYRF